MIKNKIIVNINNRSRINNFSTSFSYILLGGILVGLLTSVNSDIDSIIPSWIFPVVWTILYILMGVSSYIVYEKIDEIPRVYITQLIFNLLWSFIFFKFRWFVLAFIWIIILFVLVIKMIKEFREIDKTAGNLQIPYAIWLIVAAILNLIHIL